MGCTKVSPALPGVEKSFSGQQRNRKNPSIAQKWFADHTSMVERGSILLYPPADHALLSAVYSFSGVHTRLFCPFLTIATSSVIFPQRRKGGQHGGFPCVHLFYNFT